VKSSTRKAAQKQRKSSALIFTDFGNSWFEIGFGLEFLGRSAIFQIGFRFPRLGRDSMGCGFAFLGSGFDFLRLRCRFLGVRI